MPHKNTSPSFRDVVLQKKGAENTEFGYSGFSMTSSKESLAAMAKKTLKEADKTANQNIDAPWLDPNLAQSDSTMAAFRNQLLGETGHEEMSVNQQQNLSAVAAAASAATPDDENTANDMMDTNMPEADVPAPNSNSNNTSPTTNNSNAVGTKAEIHGVNPPVVTPTPKKTVDNSTKIMRTVPAAAAAAALAAVAQAAHSTPPAPPVTPTAPVSQPGSQQSPSALGGAPGPASSQSPVSGEEGAGDSGTPKRGKRELANTKRAAQNRAAQRAFRARKEQHIKKLEEQVTEKTQLEEQNKLLQMEINHLRTYVISLQGRLIEARGEDAVPPMPAELHNNNLALGGAFQAAGGLQQGGEKRVSEDDGNDASHPSKKAHGTEEKKK